MQSLPAREVVQAWHDALNGADPDSVLALSHPAIEIVGPLGSGFGLDLLRRWLDQTRVQLVPKRWYEEGNVVVVEEDATWRSPESGEVVGRAEVASVFHVREGRVSYYARFDALAAALSHAGIGRA